MHIADEEGADRHVDERSDDGAAEWLLLPEAELESGERRDVDLERRPIPGPPVELRVMLEIEDRLGAGDRADDRVGAGRHADAESLQTIAG